MADFAAFLGIDWANDKHDLCLLDATTNTKEFFTLAHKPEILEQFLAQLRARYPHQPIAVGLAQARGPLLFALLKYDFLTLYPIHPTTLARYREAFSPSRAKDDPTDAEYAAELLHHHRDRLTAWTPDDATTRTLQFLVEQRRRLVNDRTRFSNRLTAALKAYFPQSLTWLPDLCTQVACDFLTRWLTLAAVQRARPATMEAFFRAHHSHASLLARRLAEIKAAIPLVTDEAVVTACTLLVSALVAQLQATRQAIGEHERSVPRIPTSHSLTRCLVRVVSLPHACWLLWEPSARASLMPRPWLVSRALRPSLNAAGIPVGHVGATSVPSSCARLFTSMRANPSNSVAGPRPSIISNVARAKATRQPYAPWPSNGFASSGSAGKPARLTMKPVIWRN